MNAKDAKSAKKTNGFSSLRPSRTLRSPESWYCFNEDTPLAARGERLASHRDGRGAPPARRDDREYREYLSEEQRSRRGWIGRRMQPDFHHGLLGQEPPGRPWPTDAASRET